MTPVIETERLRLRGFRLDDFDPIFASFGDPEIHRHLGPPPTREELWGKLMRIPGQWALDGFGMFIVADRASDRAIGQSGLARFRRDMEPGFGDAPEHSWIIGEGRGRGLGLEAASAALDWMERTHAPPRTVCLISPENTPSLRLAARLGYTAYDQAQYRGGACVLLERARTAG